MDLDLTEYFRSRYTALDLLAAFGGFMGIFRWIFTHIMSAWNFEALDHFMISKLYKSEDGAFDRIAQYPRLIPYLLSFVPAFLLCKCCCLNNRKERLRAKARKTLAQEINIV